MNLLQLIIIALALIIAGSIAFIAWELTNERYHPPPEDVPADRRVPGAGQGEVDGAVETEEKEPGESKESKDPPGPVERS